MRELIKDPSLSPPMGPYCYAVAAAGLVFLGGTPGTTTEALVVDSVARGRMAGETPGRADMAAQTLQCIESVRHAGKLAGAKWSNALRFHLCLDNWKETDLFLKTYRGATGAAAPAETLVQGGLYQPSMSVAVGGIMSLSDVRPIGGPGFGVHPLLPAHAGKRSGNLLCLSAFLPVDSCGTLVSRGSAERQTRQICMNLEQIMHGAGSALSDVVRLRVFLADLRDHDVVRHEIDQVFRDRPPLCTIVEAGNPLEGARVMIEPTAYVGPKAWFDGPGNARAVRVGDLVFTNGILPLEADAPVVVDRVAKQTRAALTQLARLLDQAGSGIADICQCQVGIADLRDYDEYNRIYTNFFEFPYVARDTVEVGLGNPRQAGVRFQIEATAVVGMAERAKVVTAPDNFYHRRLAIGRYG